MNMQNDPNMNAASSSIRIKHIEHGVVIPAGSPDRIPQAMPTVEALKLRMMYYGWPGLTLAHNGDMLVSACEQITHVSPYGRDIVVRSSDQGRTWSEPEVIFDSVTDDRDISLNTMPDGTIIASWFSSDVWARPRPFPWMRPEWESLRDIIKPDTLKAMHRGWIRRSTDHGRTWEELIHPTLVGQHAGPTPLSNGELIYIGRYNLEDGSQFVATLSKDAGRTWQIISQMPIERKYEEISKKHWAVLGENHVVEVSPGKLVAAFRSTPQLATPNVHMAWSEDAGRTWTPPQDTGVFGHPPFLLKLKSGVLLCFTSQRPQGDQPKRLIVFASYDAGRTWDTKNLHVLSDANDVQGLDMGYPVAVETRPGEIFCVYYSSPTPEHNPQYDQIDPMKHGILSMRITLDQISSA